jgi:hypothetical protein
VFSGSHLAHLSLGLVQTVMIGKPKWRIIHGNFTVHTSKLLYIGRDNKDKVEEDVFSRNTLLNFPLKRYLDKCVTVAVVNFQNGCHIATSVAIVWSTEYGDNLLFL